MKKLFALLLITVSFVALQQPIQAQTYASPLIVNAGEARAFGGTTADSLLAADTLNYYVQLKCPKETEASIQLYYDETAGTQTATVKIYRSLENDEKTYTICKKGILKADWASASLTADANVLFNTKNDTVNLDDRYIKIQAISSGASSKGTLKGVIKTYTKY